MARVTSPAAALLSRPLALFDGLHRLTRQLCLVDESTLTNPSALSILTMTTRPSFRAEFKGEGGENAVYIARWINMIRERGPWSKIITATMVA